MEFVASCRSDKDVNTLSEAVETSGSVADHSPSGCGAVECVERHFDL